MASYEISLKIEVDDGAVLSKMRRLLDDTIKEAIEGMGSGTMVKVSKLKTKEVKQWRVFDMGSPYYDVVGELVSARRGAHLLMFPDGSIVEFKENQIEYIG